MCSSDLGVAAPAQRQGQAVEQDRFAGAGLAGEHRQPTREVDVQPFDQNDVADRQGDEHGTGRISVAGSRDDSRWENESEPPEVALGMPRATAAQNTLMVPKEREIQLPVSSLGS